jgi:OCT family organic cation transporter-like MFS transporter 4/5
MIKVKKFFFLVRKLFISIFSGLFLVSFILAMEMVGPEKRVFCGVVIEIYFVLGEVMASGLGYWQRDWRIVIVMATVPVFFFLLYWPVLPESTRLLFDICFLT